MAFLLQDEGERLMRKIMTWGATLMSSIRYFLIKIGISFIITLFIFGIKAPDIKGDSLIPLSIIVLLLLCFYNASSLVFRRNLLLAAVGYLLACVVDPTLWAQIMDLCSDLCSDMYSRNLTAINEMIRAHWSLQLFLGLAAVGLFLIPGLCHGVIWRRKKCSRNKDGKTGKSNSKEPVLFPERKEDIKRLASLMNHFQIVGINSSWGNGKTFFANHFYNDVCKEDFYLIKIEAISYPYDEFDQVIIDKLDDCLLREGIFPAASSEIAQLSHRIILTRAIYRYFGGPGDAHLTVFEKVKGDIGKLSKGVIIVFEDVERVKDFDALIKLFDIGEKLAGENKKGNTTDKNGKGKIAGGIKVIYEYNRGKLEEKGLSRDVLSKYVQVEMNLTELTYENLVKNLWDELKMESVNIYFKRDESDNPPDIKELNEESVWKLIHGLKSLAQNFSGSLGNDLNFKREYRAYVDGFFNNPPARVVKVYLNEIKSFLEDRPNITQKEARILVAFLFMKNFMYPEYEKLHFGSMLHETFQFDIPGDIATESDNQTAANESTSIQENASTNEKGVLFVNNADNIRNWDYFRLAKYISSSPKKEDTKENQEIRTHYARSISRIFSIDKNRLHFFIFQLFDYPGESPIDSTKVDKQAKNKNDQNENHANSKIILQKVAELEQINRWIWYYIEAGRSGKIARKEVLDGFIEKVLRNEQSEWPKLWNRFEPQLAFDRDLTEKKIYGSFNIAYKEPPFDYLLNAFDTSVVSPVDWKRFIKFYEEVIVKEKNAQSAAVHRHYRNEYRIYHLALLHIEDKEWLPVFMEVTRGLHEIIKDENFTRNEKYKNTIKVYAKDMGYWNTSGNINIILDNTGQYHFDLNTVEDFEKCFKELIDGINNQQILAGAVEEDKEEIISFLDDNRRRLQELF